ncbi:MAG TPA: MYXO-CTERM sorting domain-containing protein [Polyangiaceae bacterium]
MRLRLGIETSLAALLLSCAATAGAAPPAPSGAHPRLFMDQTTFAALQANVMTAGTAAQTVVANCQRTLDHPSDYTMRGGVDADTWPGAAVECALAYLTTQKAEYLTQAILFWRTALNDDQMMGDNMACIQGVNTDWQSLEAASMPTPVLATVTHDTGYPMRWYGPYLSMTYDWLYNAPGVDEALRAQTRTCLTAWSDHYTKEGYLNDQPGTNYNAGYIIAKTMSAIAIGNDGGADGHLWTEILDQDFAKTEIGTGATIMLSGGTNTTLGGLVGIDQMNLGGQFGALVGGDWGSWQYGPLSVLELAAAARVLEDQGALLPQMDEWANSLVVRTIYGTVPQLDGQYSGTGDLDDSVPYQTPSANQLDAVLIAHSSDAAASWALAMKQEQQLTGDGIWNALAETRSVMPADFRAQDPAPPLWYVARGSQTLYARSSWQKDAVWAAFESPPAVLDHQSFSASSFVLSRGADHLIVNPTPYGGYSSWETNAITADSATVVGDYAPSQTPWSEASLPWARGTTDGVFAARADITQAFIFAGNPSDVKYAHREWALFPEGEVVTIDRVHTSAASRNMYVSFHTNTGGGGLAVKDGVALGTVGSSQVAIHAIALSGGTPVLSQPSTNDCTLSCNYPCAQCDVARFPVDKYAVTVPGDWAVAIHAIDALGSGEDPAIVGSLNDDNFDPAPKQNTGVVGAAVYRAMKQDYVVASSAQDGASPATMTYGVPGASPGRHVVFDAPEDATGASNVTAAVQGDRCVISITASAGFAGRPLIFDVDSTANGCAVSDTMDVGPAQPPPGSGSGGGIPITTTGGGSGTGGGTPRATAAKSGGCSCRMASTSRSWPATTLALALALAFRRRRRRAA